MSNATLTQNNYSPYKSHRSDSNIVIQTRFYFVSRSDSHVRQESLALILLFFRKAAAAANRPHWDKLGMYVRGPLVSLDLHHQHVSLISMLISA